MISAARQFLLRLVALVALALAAPAMAEDCFKQKGKCFGVDWNTATPTEIAGVNVKARDDEGSTPLHTAARYNGNTETIYALIIAGANVNAIRNGGVTPLHLAAVINNPEVINFLIKNGANVSAKDEYSDTPLHWAARFNPNPESSNILIKNGANVNADNYNSNTPLHWAARWNKNPEVVNVLMKNGANVFTRDNDLKDALELGQKNEHFNKSNIYWELYEAAYKRPPLQSAQDEN